MKFCTFWFDKNKQGAPIKKFKVLVPNMKSFSIVMVIDDGEYFKMLVKKVERWNIRDIGCVWNSKSKKKI